MTPPRRRLQAVVRDAIENPVSRFPRASHQPERLGPPARPMIRPSFAIEPGQTVFTIGSCFARNVEEHLAAAGFVVPTLDFAVPEAEWQGQRSNGILNKYTPTAIRSELELAAGDEPDDRRCLAETIDGDVVDLQLAANVAVPLERGLERRQEVRQLFRRAFDADLVVITLGQTETWWDDESEMYANVFPPASIHRRDPRRFFFEQLTYDRCLEEVEAAIALLLATGRSKHVLITVSPVPLGRTFDGGDALTAYIRSKSVLRVVADTVAARHVEVDYLPAYEAIMLADRNVAFGPDLHIPDELVGEVVRGAVGAYQAVQPSLV